ncbi:hypothetical protein M231_03626 [Tremella mesenterica]|uniref:Uncharacterized protein n=1 Tax=Tremella mesenterica TaxID=5217 RepID=A0A4Q1BMQ1_TREME|nr:uncharacterized protein TREMEDRAFT_59439 [Tremella mesenterica DSM 1558]EIW73274.1 hypothetical protein TREMEDRAFT_59439 [Tremella mesenterica DSM 1558]RXK39121.1 hypothetical protein M231_03626 [Tremella mesenterica]
MPTTHNTHTNAHTNHGHSRHSRSFVDHSNRTNETTISSNDPYQTFDQTNQEEQLFTFPTSIGNEPVLGMSEVMTPQEYLTRLFSQNSKKQNSEDPEDDYSFWRTRDINNPSYSPRGVSRMPMQPKPKVSKSQMEQRDLTEQVFTQLQLQQEAQPEPEQEVLPDKSEWPDESVLVDEKVEEEEGVDVMGRYVDHHKSNIFER